MAGKRVLIKMDLVHARRLSRNISLIVFFLWARHGEKGRLISERIVPGRLVVV